MSIRQIRRELLPVLGLVLAATGCGQAHQENPKPTTGAVVTITGAAVSANKAVVDYTVTQNGQGLTADAAAALRPTWVLAELSTDPESNLPAWRSHLLTGGQTVDTLPIDGPGTSPGNVLSSVKQPGSETNGTVEDLGKGKFRYTFKNALADWHTATNTLRAGVWLGGGTAGAAQNTSTFDFVESGTVTAHDLVADADCNRCHTTVQAHGGVRTGVKVCLTCHTYQLADPDTVDPAAPLAATTATNPNPLDMGRMIHRVHRGKNLPTLYTADAQPFRPGRNAAAAASRKYSVVGYRSSEVIFGQVVSRSENNQTPVTMAAGVGYPQDIRNCAACHGEGAPQADQHITAISRRTCQGCHPDVWFHTDAGDAVHRVHGPGTQANDTACATCHTTDKLISIHTGLTLNPAWNRITAKIVSVQNMLPGQKPTMVFTLSDRDGTLTPPGSPNPSTDGASPVPRALQSLSVLVSGPTSPDYTIGNSAASEKIPLTITADANGQFSYSFTKAIPANATGTWAVSLEARRALDIKNTPPDRSKWPFTGEAVTEYADNPVQYVDLAVGTSSSGSPVARRQVVTQEKCNSCHQDLSIHGGLRHNVEYCNMCHTPDATDWASRPRSVDNTSPDGKGNVILASTFDNIEERSIHLKTLVHRIHTGEHEGSAELGRSRPFVVYGHNSSLNFFDEVRFPSDLASCTVCHEGESYQIESVPAGALPTVANETATILHKKTAAHQAGEPSAPPIQAACLGCHDTSAAESHAQQHTIAGVEQCAQCHGKNSGLLSVDKVHGLK